LIQQTEDPVTHARHYIWEKGNQDEGAERKGLIILRNAPGYEDVRKGEEKIEEAVTDYRVRHRGSFTMNANKRVKGKRDWGGGGLWHTTSFTAQRKGRHCEKTGRDALRPHLREERSSYILVSKKKKEANLSEDRKNRIIRVEGGPKTEHQ